MPMEPGWPSWREEKTYKEGRYQLHPDEPQRQSHEARPHSQPREERPKKRTSQSALATAAAEKKRQSVQKSAAQKKRLAERRAYRQKMRRRRIFFSSLAFLLIMALSCSLTMCSIKALNGKSSAKGGGFANVVVKEPLLSDAAVLMDPASKEVLAQKHGGSKKAPASLTKMVTVYTALKSGINLDDTVVLDTEAFQNLGDAAQAGLFIGETVSLRDLIYATILPSGADATQALALACAPSTEAFTERMNEQVKTMGLKNTHFANPVGIDDPDHYTTAYDMALFLAEAIQDPTFFSVISASTYEIKGHPGGLKMEHRLFDLLDNGHDITYDGYDIIGGKTGYTLNAGVCLATVAQDDLERTLIAVTLDGEGDLDNYYAALKDAESLYDAGFGKGEE